MHEDSAAFIACIPRLRRYARALVGDRSAADDLVQDTLERAWNKLSLWRRGSDMRPWLFGILHNLHIDQVRKPKLTATSVEEEEFRVATRATQSDGLEVRDLEAALRLLPDELREILLLVALEDMTYEEVSKTLRIPLGTVMSRLARGREKLRALMEGGAKISSLKVIK